MTGLETNAAAGEPGPNNYARNLERDSGPSAPAEERPGKRWNAKQGALVTVGVNLVMSVLGIFTGVMAARLLGPKGRGELAAIQAWPTALASLSLLGTSEAVLYFCAKEPQKRAAYFSAALLIGTAGALFFSVAGFVAMPWLLASQSSAVVWGARIFLFQIWMYLLIAMPTEVLRAAGRFTAWNLLRLCPMLLWAGILAVAWLAGERRAVPVASAYIAVGWLILVPAVLLLRREGLSAVIPRRQELRETLKFGLPAVGTFMPRMLNLRLDQILMAGLLPAATLGQYVVAVAWGSAGASLMHGLSAVVVPKLAAQRGYGARSGGLDLARATRLGTLTGVFTAVVLLILAPIGIRVFFGGRFSPAISVARLLAIAGGFSGLNMVLSEGMRGLGRPAAVLRAELAALIVTVGGLWLLLRPMGIYGAALVSLLAYFVTVCWLLTEARLVTQVSIGKFIFPRRADLLVLTTVIGELSGNLAARSATVTWLARLGR